MSISAVRRPLAAALRGEGGRAGWVSVPRRGDARVPFACILTLYAAMGTLWLGFNRNPSQIVTIVATACVLDMFLHLLIHRRRLFPLSAYITGLSLALLLNFAHGDLVPVLPVFLAISSKYVFTYNGDHVFNPSLFGVVGSLLLAGDSITTAPAYQWGGTWGMSAFMVMAALTLFVFKVGRGWLVGSFLGFYALQTALRAYVMRAHLPPEMLFLGTISTPPFFLFTFFMLTDPKTSPSSRRGQITTAAAITLVDLYLHTKQSVFTFFYAAAAVAAARLLWLHARRLVSQSPSRYLRSALLSPARVRVMSVVTAVALVGGAAYARIRPHVALSDAGFVLEEVPPHHSGIDIVMDEDTFNLLDPRLHHIGKWLLSVGASVSAADVTGDGAVDLFFTSPLARARDRTALYVNEGGFRFRRVPIPVLRALNEDPRSHGVASGSLLFDHDSDGDRDILVLVSFGRTRLLENMTSETGRTWFRDVTDASGVGRYTVTVAANALDYDSDGDHDLLIGRVMPVHLPGYRPPERLNIFRLPEAARPGDRRMFHFMHDGWHDADNGGRNVLLANQGDGTFEEVSAAAVGMPETRWSLSIGTGDVNSDGRTDVYIANDFGPDDLYMNDGGAFHRVSGRFFGEIGKDTYKGMNSSLADVDRNGRLDIYVSNVHHALQAEGSLLWMNHGNDEDGNPILEDEATTQGALNEDRFGWGAAVGDLDNDGWPDIVQANGMVDDRLDDLHPGCPDYWYVNHKLMQSGSEIHTYADQWGDLRGRCIFPNEKRRVYLNRGDGARPRFVDVADIVGLTEGDNSRGVALADLDDDGRLDVVIANQHGAPTVMRNRASAGVIPSWIGIELVGDGITCGTGAQGSTVVVERTGAPPQLAEAQAATGFSGQNDPRLHFGLGAESPDEVDVSVRWCGSERANYRLRAGTYHRLVMGRRSEGGRR